MLDYHNHLEGQLNRQWLDKFLIQARSRGINEVGISEHSYNFKELLPLYEGKIGSLDTALGRRQQEWLYAKGGHWSLAEYFDLLLPLRDQLGLKIGLELDWFPGSAALVNELLGPWPWDYIIGSVHWLDGWGYDLGKETWQGRDIIATWDRYLDIAIDGASSGCFDIMGHADAIKVYGYFPFPWPEGKFIQLARTMARHGVAVELNTAFNYRGYSSNFCPDPRVLGVFHRHGVPLTFGSDAHIPEQAGLLLDQARTSARNCGYSCYLGFDRRTPVKHNL